MNNFGDKLRDGRERLGLSRRELADKAGVSEGAVYMWEEKGKIPLRRSTINLARALGTSEEYFLGGVVGGDDAPAKTIKSVLDEATSTIRSLVGDTTGSAQLRLEIIWGRPA